MDPLLTATQLTHWADERRAQDMLPLLIRRLILATVNPVLIDIASGDSINRPGYDGVLRTVEGGLLVPAGQSVWEMGVNSEPAKKANEDYAARKAKPAPIVPAETTFVFVTPRRWQGKSDWAAKKRAENFWLGVLVLDADDLDQWLDRCTAVETWARRKIVGLPEGLRDLEEIWEIWSRRTNPPLVPDIFITGRTREVQRVRQWLTGRPACLRIRADTADEAVGFLAAITQQLDEPTRDRVFSKSLVVMRPDTWRAVAGKIMPLTLIATCPSLGSDAQAVACGHHVVIAYGNDSAGMQVDIELPHLRRADLEAALQKMELGEDRCRKLANESRGRLSAVIDLLGGGNTPPHWAIPAIAPQLVPFFLAGSWCDNQGDTEAMATLARCSTDEVAQRLSRWTNESDPPIRRVGGTWEWISRQRAWSHFARHITAADLTAFRQVAAEVLGERDPRLDLAPNQRWMASLHNCAPRYSEPLRNGLSEALIMLATRSNDVRTGINVTGMVNVLVGNLFRPVPAPDQWYSLTSILPLLAEAAPSEFLTAVERDVVGNESVRNILFQDEGYFGGSRHTHLLWALETLAWSSEHLPNVAVALAGLAVKDPGGRTANRPSESLRTIFLPWHPHTTARVPHRLAAIDTINRHYPDVAFDLVLQLLPTRHDSATPTSRPRWRQWAAEWQAGVSRNEYSEYVSALFHCALTWAGSNPRRWASAASPCCPTTR